MSDFAHWMNHDGASTGPKSPFWKLDFNKDDEVLAWLNAEIDFLKEQGRPRHWEQKKNLAAFRGIRLANIDTRNRDEQATENQGGRSKSKSPRVIYNHMVDIVQQHVSRLTKYRGAVAAVPTSDDQDDRVTALIAEDLVTKFWDKVKIDRMLPKHHRRKRLFGEDYIGVYWNQSAGPYDLDWLGEQFAKKGLGDPRKMSRGERSQKLKQLGEFETLTVNGKDGKTLKVDSPIRRGEVEYRLHFSWDVFMQRADDYDRSPMGTWREWIEADTLKALHPKAKDKITPDANSMMWDADTCEDVSARSKVEVFHTYHRSTEELDQGRYIKWCRTAVLKNEINPYSGYDDTRIIPMVRTVDIDTPAVMNGDATVTHCRGPAAVYNNLVSLKIRNRYLFAYPKWAVPANSVNKDALVNNSTVFSYKGPTPPILIQPRVDEGNDSVFMQETKTDYQQIGGVYGISRGEPPKGITAAVALTYLDEKESEGQATSINDHSVTLDELALQTLWIMADHYDDGQGRMEDLLGKKRAHLLKTFKAADLRNIADLMIQNMTALPQQKSARLQFLLEFKKEWPEAVPSDVAIDVLGLADVERLKNAATVALRKAEEENWSLINGAEAQAPIPGEFHLAHYRAHRREMNEPSYVYLPEVNREAFQDHLMATEFLMSQIAAKNPPYAAQIAQQFPDFPLFYVPMEPIPVMPPQMPQGPQGGMPMGQEMAPGMPVDPMLGVPPGVESMTPEAPGMAPGMESVSPVGA